MVMAKKNNNGTVKNSKQIFKIGRILSFTGLGISLLSLIGNISALSVSISNNNKKADYLDTISATAQYQEYFQDEKYSIDQALNNKEITNDEYIIKFDELKNDGVEKYIEEKGSEEQKEALGDFESRETAAKTTSRVFSSINYLGLATTVSALGVVMHGSKLRKKEIDEDINDISERIQKLNKLCSPFPELEGFEEDEVELPSIDD